MVPAGVFHPEKKRRKHPMNIQMIPLSALVPTAANVGKTGVKIGIDELAALPYEHWYTRFLENRPPSGCFSNVSGKGQSVREIILSRESPARAKPRYAKSCADAVT
jgi:hypothetical protein